MAKNYGFGVAVVLCISEITNKLFNRKESYAIT